MIPEPTLKAAIYYRVSTDMQELGSQKHAVERWLKENEIQLSDCRQYVDMNRSGSTIEREQFQAMLSDIDKGLADTIVVYKLDRFSRDASTAIRLLLELDAKGVAFVSVTQPALNLGHDMPFRRMILACFAELAQLEREMIVARVKSGLEAAKARGVRLGAPLKIGAKEQRQARRLRDEGLSYRKIANKLGFSVAAVHAAVNGPDLTEETR